MTKSIQQWIYRLAEAGSLPSDTADWRLRKAILIFLALIYCLAGVFWGIFYFALGLFAAGMIPISYSILSGCCISWFFRSKRYGLFCFVQLLLILVLPFLLHYALGGFAASSAVMIWAILSPIGALMFTKVSRALPWFLAYLFLMIVSGVYDGRMAEHAVTMPASVTILFFVMNLGGVSTIAYVLLRYFVLEREQAMAVLDMERRQVIREKERLDKIKSVMAKFVPETAKSIIEKDPEQAFLDRHIQNATVLFLDIEGFTLLLQEHPMEEINRVTEAYFSVFIDVIQENDGDVNEMAGDGMMVLFLHPEPEVSARRAARAAVTIRDRSQKISREERLNLFPVLVNIGISSGEVHVGSTKVRGTGGDRWTFTASGPVTILAARLSDYAEGGQILVEAETARRIQEAFPLTPLGEVQLKNFKDPVKVYQV